MAFPTGETSTPDAGFEFMMDNCSTDEPTYVSSLIGISAGRDRRRPTRSASGSGSRLGRTRGGGRRTFDLSRFHADALNLGPLGLDPLRAALARI